MSGGRIDGDMVVALLGLVMALFLVSHTSAVQRLSWGRRLRYGALWAVIIGVVAVLADRLGR